MPAGGQEGVLRCMYCGSTRIRFDPETNEYVCLDCGSVQPVQVYDVAYEVKDWEKTHRGPPTTFGTSGELATTIQSSDISKLNTISSRLHSIKIMKMMKYTSFSTNDTIIMRVKDVLNRVITKCSNDPSKCPVNLNLSQSDYDTIIDCVLRVKSGSHETRKLNIAAATAACIYVLSKTNKLKVEIDRIISLLILFDVSSSAFFNYVDAISRVFNVNLIFNNVNEAIEYDVDRFLRVVNPYISYLDSVSVGSIKKSVISLVSKYLDLVNSYNANDIHSLVFAALWFVLTKLETSGKIKLGNVSFTKVMRQLGLSLNNVPRFFAVISSRESIMSNNRMNIQHNLYNERDTLIRLSNDNYLTPLDSLRGASRKRRRILL